MEKIIYKGREVFPVKYDLVFKAVFVSGGDLELLASLLSSILGINISAENMTITNTEIPPTHADGKMSRLDIRVKTDDGKHIDVEIQLGDEHNMAKRSLFYESKLYTEQMASKMEFEEICPAIAINILGFTFLPFKKYHSRFRMIETEEGYELTDVFEIDFIELPKVPPEVSENAKDLWMRFISADSEEVLEMLAKQSPVMDKAVKKLIYVSADEQLRYELDMREKTERDYYSAMKTSHRKGKEEGRQEGRQEGAEETKMRSAERFLKKGIREEDIAEALEMPLSKILEIKEKLL